MILDDTNLFSDSQVVTTTAASEDYIDLGATGTPTGGAAALTRDIGGGHMGEFVLVIEAQSGTSPTLTVALQVDDNASFTSATEVLQFTPTVTAGNKMSFKLPEGINERYVRLNYTVGGTSPSITISAGITMGAPTSW